VSRYEGLRRNGGASPGATSALECDQFRRVFANLLGVARAPTYVNLDVAAVSPASRSVDAPAMVAHAPLALLLMRRADVRKLLENVGVRFQAAGRAFALGQKREAVIDHVVREDAAVGIHAESF
jgi:hypothetical protein